MRRSLQRIVEGHVASHRFRGQLVGGGERPFDLLVDAALPMRIVLSLRATMAAVKRRISSSSASPGNAVHQPHAIAVAASIGAPVNNSSIARLRPMFLMMPIGRGTEDADVHAGNANVAGRGYGEIAH